MSRPTREDDAAAAEAEVRVPVAEERVSIRKTETERVAARIGVSTREEEVEVDETLRREHAEVERVPMDVLVDEAPQVRTEDGVMIVPVVEEVLVRRFRLVEELRIAVTATQEPHRETVTLRRQEVALGGPDAPDGDGAA